MLPLGMPFRRERAAPALDLSDPLGILRYFQDLEYLFEKHQVSDDQDKKHAAIYYPSIQVERAWKCDDTFEDQAASFGDFKVAIIALYPATLAILNPTFADLERLVAERSHQPFRSKPELGEYYRNFRVVSQSLIERGHISKGTQARQLLASLEPSLATAVWARLSYQFPDRLPDDLYDTSDIYEAALYALTLQYESVFLEPRQDFSPLTLASALTSVSPAVLTVPTPPRLAMPTVYTLPHVPAIETRTAMAPSSTELGIVPASVPGPVNSACIIPESAIGCSTHQPEISVSDPLGPSALNLFSVSPTSLGPSACDSFSIPPCISISPRVLSPSDSLALAPIASKPSSVSPGPSACDLFSIVPSVLPSTHSVPERSQTDLRTPHCPQVPNIAKRCPRWTRVHFNRPISARRRRRAF